MANIDPHVVATYLWPILGVFTLAVAYFVGLRPILRQTPVFKSVYDAEAGLLYSVNIKFANVKQKLVGLFFSAASILVLAHDEIAPLITQAGVDPSLILPKVPTWVWPVSTIIILWIINYLRNRADRHAQANAIALLQAGQPLVAPAPGLPITTLPSPTPVPLGQKAV